MKHHGKVFALLLAAMLLLASCAGGAQPPSGGAQQPAGPQEPETLKVALILPGKKDDVSWNQAMFLGIQAVAEEYADKIDVTVVEEVYEPADIEPALLDFASEGYNVIFGHGFQFMEPIIKVGEMYPNVMFALGTGYKTLSNTCVYDVHLQYGGYLMGILAASMTESNKIGVIGGGNVSEIFRGHEGYKYAARLINPDIEIQEVYTGDWTDSVGAKEAAISMYDSGVDIIWHSGDGIGLGAIEGAREKNKLILSNVADSHVLAPDNVLSGVVYDWSAVIKEILDDILNDDFVGRNDKFYWITEENGGVVYAPFYPNLVDRVPDEVKELVEATYQDIAAGLIELPDFEAQ